MPTANSFPDGRRGRVRDGDTRRVGAYAASAMPVGGPGMIRRTFPSGTTGFPLPGRRAVASRKLRPFQLVRADDDDGAKVRVVTSTLAGDVPSGFSPGDDPPFLLDVSDGDIVFACLTFDVSSSSPPVTSRTLGKAQTVPDDDPASGTFYYRIGSVAVSDGKSTPVNDVYGAIEASCYRQWFAFPAAYAVDWKSNALLPGAY